MADTLCVVFQMFVSIMAVFFVGFALFFTLFKIRKITILEQSKLIKKHEERLDDIDKIFKNNYKENHTKIARIGRASSSFEIDKLANSLQTSVYMD